MSRFHDTITTGTSENEVAGEPVMASVAEALETVSPDRTTLRDDALFEVVGTNLVEKPPMGAFESGLATLLVELIGPFARFHGFGQVFSETLFDLRPSVGRSRRPDLAFVSAKKWPVNKRPPEGESWPIIPDLAVEIVSPTNYAAEIIERVHEYERAGVRLVWVVYPSAREIHVFDAGEHSVIRRLQGADWLKGEPVLPGFELDLAMLFGDAEAE
jgi:Uma2 family endonuclease